MKKSRLLQDLKIRLHSLLEDQVFAKARQTRAKQDRARLDKGGISDALFVFNTAVSEEILHLDESSLKGEVSDLRVSRFRDDLAFYLKQNGTGQDGYDTYIAILSEYLALVAEIPLHPPEVRCLENDPPEDTGNIRYCGWRSHHLKDKNSLCPYCNCLPWPKAVELSSKKDV